MQASQIMSIIIGSQAGIGGQGTEKKYKKKRLLTNRNPLWKCTNDLPANCNSFRSWAWPGHSC